MLIPGDLASRTAPRLAEDAPVAGAGEHSGELTVFVAPRARQVAALRGRVREGVEVQRAGDRVLAAVDGVPAAAASDGVCGFLVDPGDDEKNFRMSAS